MNPDVLELQEFYLSPQGRMVKAILVNKLKRIWPSAQRDVILSLGYGMPLTDHWEAKDALILALMQDCMGVTTWPPAGQNRACMGLLDSLPFEDDSINRILMVHALENASDADAVLQEAWRVLKPQGRLLVIVPNRHGVWARCEKTPFGTGRPYASSQLRKALKAQRFVVNRLYYALAMPACRNRLGLWLAPYVEHVANFLFAGFGGVIMAEAIKQVYAPSCVKTRASRRRLVMPLSVPKVAVPTSRGDLAFNRNSCSLSYPAYKNLIMEEK